MTDTLTGLDHAVVRAGDYLHIPTIVRGNPGHLRVCRGPFHFVPSVTTTEEASSDFKQT